MPILAERFPARALVEVGNFLFRYRNAMFPLACLPLLLPGPQPFHSSFVATLVGAAVCGLGQFVRALTIGLRYIIRGGRKKRIYAEELVTEGIYSHARNPMYVGNLLIVLGVGLAANSWLTILVGVPMSILMYGCIVAAEEEYLGARFGSAFQAYCAQVPRWIPRLRGLPDTVRSMHFQWRRLLVKEYGTPFGWIVVLAAVTLHNFWSDGEWSHRHSEIVLVVAVVGVFAVFWGAARSLKKSRVIQADRCN